MQIKFDSEEDIYVFRILLKKLLKFIHAVLNDTSSLFINV